MLSKKELLQQLMGKPITIKCHEGCVDINIANPQYYKQTAGYHERITAIGEDMFEVERYSRDGIKEADKIYYSIFALRCISGKF